MSWHKTSKGVTCWFRVFEDSDAGLIHLLRGMPDSQSLRAATENIIVRLFARAGDEDFHNLYIRRLDSIIPKGEAYSHHHIDDNTATTQLALAKNKVFVLMRDIRDTRIQKAQEHIEKQAQKATARKAAALQEKKFSEEFLDAGEGYIESADSTANDTNAEGEETPVAKEVLEDPNESFSTTTVLLGETVCEMVRQRFAALSTGVIQRDPHKPLPFLLSTEFAAHFESLLWRHLLRDVLKAVRPLVLRVANQPPNQRQEYLQTQLYDPKVRAFLWSRWQEIWDEVINIQKLPQNPNTERRKLSSALNLSKRNPLSPQEWREQVQKIQEHNRKAANIWQEIARPSTDYDPPTHDDQKVLRQIFSHTSGNFSKQIRALIQIAEQGENIGRTFDLYTRSQRNIDAALLAAAYQAPHLFLRRREDDSEKNNLQIMLSGYDLAFQRKEFPLTLKYLIA